MPARPPGRGAGRSGRPEREAADVTSAILDRAPAERVRSQTAKAARLLRRPDPVRPAAARRAPVGDRHGRAARGLADPGAHGHDPASRPGAARGGRLLWGLSGARLRRRGGRCRDRDPRHPRRLGGATRGRPPPGGRPTSTLCIPASPRWTTCCGKGASRPARVGAYAALDDRFHALIGSLARSPNLTRQLERAWSLPFAAPGSLLPAQAHLAERPVDAAGRRAGPASLHRRCPGRGGRHARPRR